MLRKLTIRNFESHEDSEIEFTDGLNLIIGQSNQGKSSIIRALALVAANRFDKDCVRNGADFCEVRAETDRGWVECRRGETVNEWRVCRAGETPKAYRNIGAGMPPGALEALGIGERPRGDLKEIPNIMFQLEKHYMLAEIDGKKATANLVARMMDDAIGLGGLEELIKDMAADYASGRKHLTEVSARLGDAEAAVLPADEFEERERQVASLRERLEQTAEDAALLERGRGYAEKARRLIAAIAAVERRAVIGMGLEVRLAIMEGDAARLAKLRKAAAIAKMTEIVRKRAALGTGLPERLTELAATGRRLIRLRRAAAIRRELARTALLAATAALDGQMAAIAAKRAEIAQRRAKLTAARDLWRRLQMVLAAAKAAAAAEEAAENRLHSYKDALGVCPLCGKPLAAETPGAANTPE